MKEKPLHVGSLSVKRQEKGKRQTGEMSKAYAVSNSMKKIGKEGRICWRERFQTSKVH